MKNIANFGLIISISTLAGCTTVTPPEGVKRTHGEPEMAYVEVMQDVAKRITYKQEPVDRDYWVRGCPPEGDCEEFALCAMEELELRGINAHVDICEDREGDRHAFATTSDTNWIVDPTWKRVVPMTPKNCHKHIYTCVELSYDWLLCITMSGDNMGELRKIQLNHGAGEHLKALIK
jgi:hypothetical protein